MLDNTNILTDLQNIANGEGTIAQLLADILTIRNQ